MKLATLALVLLLPCLPAEEYRDFRPMLRHLAQEGLTSAIWEKELQRNDLAFVLIQIESQLIARHFHPALSPQEKNAIVNSVSLWLVEKKEHLSERRSVLEVQPYQLQTYQHPLRKARILLAPRERSPVATVLNQIDDKKFYILGALFLGFGFLLLLLMFLLPGTIEKVEEPGPEPEFSAYAVATAPDADLDQMHAADSALPRVGHAAPIGNQADLTWDGSTGGDRPLPQTDEAIFEQEEWNLPGFHCLEHPRMDLPQNTGFAESAAYYRMADFTPAASHDLESFTRTLLSDVSAIVPQAQATLFLRNQRGQYEPCQGWRGQLVLSGSVLEKHRPSPVTINRLKEHQCLLSEDGSRAYLALNAGERLLGILTLSSPDTLYNQSLLSELHFLASKYAHVLSQVLVHEQATTDPESTLKNGIEFQTALAREFQYRHDYRSERLLILIQFSIAAGPSEFRTIGPLLRRTFSKEYQIYRIASDAVGIIGPAREESHTRQMLQKLLQELSPFRGIALVAGSARLDRELQQPQEWFDRARAALQESQAGGTDRWTGHQAATAPEFIRA